MLNVANTQQSKKNIFTNWKKEDILKFFFQRKILVSPDFVDAIDKGDLVIDIKSLNLILTNKFNILTQQVFNRIINKNETLEEDKNKRASDSDSYSVKVVENYPERPKKINCLDFVKHYNKRFKQIEAMLRGRAELSNLTAINKVLNKRDSSQVSIIGMLNNSSLTKNNSLRLTLEDPTGSINVWVKSSQKDIFNTAKNLPLDSVVGITGFSHNKSMSANKIILPDIPQKELKKGPEETYAIFLSDLHVGSTNFLADDFNKFLSWINGSLGSEKHRDIAKKTRYIFIAGDIVDGVGIYKGQEKELIIKDVAKQYEKVASLLSKIPDNKALIIIPGNHDAIKLAEPQPPLNKDFATPLSTLKNAFLLSNPSMVNIESSRDFSGFDVLMYHGFSFDYYIANINEIRLKGGYDNPEVIMKFLLQLRHLAPTHTSSLFSPVYDKDPMVIDRIPDFFVSGHIHKTDIANYRGTTLISGSCWQSRTKFQEKVGHHPEPSRVPIVNLQTRKYKVLKFLT